jgi:hypothetical protein
MRMIPFVILASVLTLACNVAGADVKGSGTSRTEARTVPAFKGLSVSLAVQLEVTVGEPQSVVLVADDNLLPLIRTRTSGDTLVIDSKKSFSSKKPLVVRISTPSLEALASSGVTNGTIKGIAGRRFAVNVSGSGDVELTGKTDALSIDLSGSGAIRARRLRAGTVAASVSGSGAVQVTATDALAADISGSATIDYWGSPKSVTRDVTGSGTINAR